jgi:hypothetical protein
LDALMDLLHLSYTPAYLKAARDWVCGVRSIIFWSEFCWPHALANASHRYRRWA